MSRPRFLADHDFNEHILDGVLRREPAIEIVRAREVNLQDRPDSELLEFAAGRQLLILSHDVNTMPAAAYARIESGASLTGLLMVQQSQPISAIIEDVVSIWSASELEEWTGLVCFLPF